jgi:hypothetical protein
MMNKVVHNCARPIQEHPYTWPGVDKYRAPGRHGARIFKFMLVLFMVFLACICKKRERERGGLAPEFFF